MSTAENTQGWVYNNINRYFSQPLAKILSGLNCSPNMGVAISFIIALLASYFVASGDKVSMMIGGGLFQLSAIFSDAVLDLKRLKPAKDVLGKLVISIANVLRFTLFFSALGLGIYRTGAHEFYFYGVLILLAIGLYIAGRMGHMIWNQNKENEETKVVQNEDTSNRYTPFVKMFMGIEKQDVMAFLAFIMCLAGMYIPLFCVVFAMSFIVAIGLMNASKKKKSGFSMPDPFFFYIIGVVLLCALIYNMDINTIAESLSKIGYGVIVAFATAILWIVVNTWSLSILLEHKMPFKSLLYVELTGNAYNNIIPLAGLGGEPYKIKVISEHVGIDNASRVIIQNRLIHSLTGLLFTALMVILCLLVVDLSAHPRYFNFLIAAAIISAAISFTIAWITLSSAPGKFTGFILKKLNFLKDYKNEPLPLSRFIVAVFWQVLGRAFNLVEIYVIFVLLGFSPSFPDLVCVSTFLSLSGAIFSFIPQGIGVNEASINEAFSILGYATTLGLSFGLIRRARVMVWALLGVALHLYVLFSSKVNKLENQ